MLASSVLFHLSLCQEDHKLALHAHWVLAHVVLMPEVLCRCTSPCHLELKIVNCELLFIVFLVLATHLSNKTDLGTSVTKVLSTNVASDVWLHDSCQPNACLTCDPAAETHQPE